MRKHKVKGFVALFITVVFCFSIVGTAFAELVEPPPLPDAYYGTVKLNGEDAPVGSTIVAKIGDKVVGSITVKVAGKYGEEGALGQKLLVQGTSKDLGKTVTFEINGVKCDQTVIYKSGIVAKLDLTATGTPPVVDTQKPYVVSTNPPNGAKDVDITALNITVQFNEDVTEGVYFGEIKLKDDTNQISISKSISGKILTVSVASGFNYGKTYTLTIPKDAIKDLAGNTMESDYVLTFSTKQQPTSGGGSAGGGTAPPPTGGAGAIIIPAPVEDKEPPKVIKTFPADGDVNVDINAVVEVTFNENINVSANFEKIELKNLTKNIPVSITKSISNGYILIIKPSQLERNTKYQLIIPKEAVADSAGNKNDTDYVISFTTTSTYEQKLNSTIKNTINILDAATVTLDENSLTGSDAKVVYNLVDVSTIKELSGKKLINKPFELKFENCKLEKAYTISVNLLTSQIKPNDVIEVYQIDNNGNITKVKAKIPVRKDKVILSANSTYVKIAVAATPVESIYSDISTSWAKNSIAFMTSRGIINGYPDGTFRPKKGITRAETAVLLSRMLELSPKKDKTEIFADKSAIPSWAKDAISACVENSILLGAKASDGKIYFKPNNNITRIELAVVLARILKNEKPDSQSSTLIFADKDKIPNWAVEDLGIAVKYGIVSGYTDNTFRPTNNVTREEASAMIMRLIEQLEK